jgi:hypothetical protein
MEAGSYTSVCTSPKFGASGLMRTLEIGWRVFVRSGMSCHSCGGWRSLRCPSCWPSGLLDSKNLPHMLMVSLRFLPRRHPFKFKLPEASLLQGGPFRFRFASVPTGRSGCSRATSLEAARPATHHLAVHLGLQRLGLGGCDSLSRGSKFEAGASLAGAGAAFTADHAPPGSFKSRRRCLSQVAREGVGQQWNRR